MLSQNQDCTQQHLDEQLNSLEGEFFHQLWLFPTLGISLYRYRRDIRFSTIKKPRLRELKNCLPVKNWTEMKSPLL